MASRLRSRLKQLRKNMGMIPIDAKRQEQEKSDVTQSIALAELAASHALSLLAKGITGWSINPSTMEIIYHDGRVESMLAMPQPEPTGLPRATLSDRLNRQQS